MLSITVKNVNEALPIAAMNLNALGDRQDSRAGEVIKYPTPVCTTYLNPRERVLLYPERDANPFFHLFESLWILGGKQNVSYLARFNKRMSQFSDDGVTFHAAYGHRLRFHFGGDQIEAATEQLREQPNTRQAVLQIWDCGTDLNWRGKDIPCNDLIFLDRLDGKLNMTVCCRSNDMIWGAYGANVVQFSMLQEYIADKLGTPVGVYRQFSNNFHVYTDNPFWSSVRDNVLLGFDPYGDGSLEPFALGATSGDWDTDLTAFLEASRFDNEHMGKFKTVWFERVAKPMYIAWLKHRISNNGLSVVGDIAATDWREAARQWLKKREEV